MHACSGTETGIILTRNEKGSKRTGREKNILFSICARKRERKRHAENRETARMYIYSKKDLLAIFPERTTSATRSFSFCRLLLIIGAQLRVPVSTRGRRYMFGSFSWCDARSPHVTTVRRSHGDRISDHHVRDTRVYNWPSLLCTLLPFLTIAFLQTMDRSDRQLTN